MILTLISWSLTLYSRLLMSSLAMPRPPPPPPPPPPRDDLPPSNLSCVQRPLGVSCKYFINCNFICVITLGVSCKYFVNCNYICVITLGASCKYSVNCNYKCVAVYFKSISSSLSCQMHSTKLAGVFCKVKLQTS